MDKFLHVTSKSKNSKKHAYYAACEEKVVFHSISLQN